MAPTALAWGLAGAVLFAGPAGAGLVFREAETIEEVVPGGGSRQIRQVFADGEACRVVIEEASEATIPAGAYVLASVVDAFLVDPAERTVAPLDPTAMVPAGEADPPGRSALSDVTLEVLFDAPGPALLGLPTRHLVYRLRYREDAAAPAAGAGMLREERHEVWLAPWPEGEPLPAAWHRLRLAEDGGTGPERADLRDALGEIHRQGMVLAQVIERREPGAPAEAAPLARVLREVTAFRREAIPATAFEPPPGFTAVEFLAPVAEQGTGSVAAPGPSGP